MCHAGWPLWVHTSHAHHACATATHAPVKPRESALIPFCNVPPPRGQARLHLIAFLGHRLPSQTNTSLFCVLCPHSCAPGRTSRSITHRSRPSMLNLGDLKRWASRKKVATYWYEYPINPIKPWAGVLHLQQPALNHGWDNSPRAFLAGVKHKLSHVHPA